MTYFNLPGQCFTVYMVIANKNIDYRFFCSNLVWAPTPYAVSHFV